MKLISCHIDNFGVLRNFDMIFGEGLNIIMRDNGWGKSTLAAFLKAMLYGYGQKSGGAENERKRYLPWQGGKYGGSLIFEKDGKQYRIVRTFGETPQSDTSELSEFDSGKPVTDVENVGEWLFRLNADAFKRCAFINQNPADQGSSGQSIHERLSVMLSEAGDIGGYDTALAQLARRMEDYDKDGDRGYVHEIQKRIDELSSKQKSAEENIRRVGKWRSEIEKLDRRLEQEEKTIAELRKKLEQHNSAKKERDTVLKLYSQMNEGQELLDKKINSLLKRSNGNIPELSEIQALRQSCEEAERLSGTLAKMREQTEKKASEIRTQYNALIAEKSGLEKELELISAEGAVPEEEELQTVRQGMAELIRVSEALETLSAQKEKKKAEFLKKQEELMKQKSEWKGKLDSLLSAGGIPDEEEVKTVRQTVAEISRAGQALDALRAQAQEEAQKLRDRHSELLERQNDLENEYNTALMELGEDPPTLAEIRRAEAVMAQLPALNEERDNIKAKAARIKERIDSVERRYRVKIPGTAEISDILKLSSEVDELRREIWENENSDTFAQAKERKSELLGIFGEELPEAEYLREVEGDISAARALESESAELVAQISRERSKRDRTDAEMKRIESEDKALVFTLREPKPVAGIICIALAVVAAAAGVIFTPVAFAATGILTVAGIVMITRTKKKKKEYAKQRSEFNEKRRVTAEEFDRLKEEYDQMSRNIRNKQAEAQAKQNEADRIYSDAVSCISEWVTVESNDDLLQGCSELRSELTELKNVQETVSSFEEKLEELHNRLDVLNEELEAKLLILPFDTEKMPVSERADAALADIEILDQLRTDMKSCEEQLSAQNAKLRQLMDSIRGILNKCGLTAANAAEGLPDAERRVLEAEKIGHSLEEQRGRVIEFERQNGKALAGYTEEEPDSAEARLRHEIEGLNAEIQGILDKYSCDNEAVEAWLDLSEKRAFFREKIFQRQRELNKQLEDLKAANGEFLSEKKTAPDSAEGKLLSQKSAIEARTGAVLGKYRVPSEFVAQWLDISEKRLEKKKLVMSKLGAAGKQAADFRAANKAVLDGERLPDDPVAVNIKARLRGLTESAAAFSEKYGLSGEKELTEQLNVMEERAAGYAELCRKREVYASQIKDFEAKHRAVLKKQNSDNDRADYESLKLQLMEFENNRDLMLRERAQTEGNIRHADEALGPYRTVIQQLRTLSEEKQEAQESLYILKKSAEFLKKAKESLISRYIGQIEASFNRYLSGWIMEKDLRGIVDMDLNVTMEKDGKRRKAEAYSTGYSDIIDFCMRMALIDTLFEEERPFIIMDDPFVNLDEEGLEHAMGLLKAVSADNQTIYFACHPIRAKESANAEVRIEREKSVKPSVSRGQRAPTVRKARYDLRPADAILPEGANRRITCSIFSLGFVTEPALSDDSEFEVFFVDEADNVICDRRRLSYSDETLTPEKVRFFLNTGKATGKVYTLIIRNAASPENEAVRMIPYSAAIPFAFDDD